MNFWESISNLFSGKLDERNNEETVDFISERLRSSADRNAELDREIASLEKHIEELKKQLEEISENKLIANKKIVADSPVAIDFQKMNAFSIERMLSDDGNEVMTTIGYIVNGEVKEWYLNCSQEIHNELVKLFLQSKS